MRPRHPSARYHATMTSAAHYAQMPMTPHSPDPDRIGVLILRAWLERTADDPQLRIRLVGRNDVTRDAEDTASAAMRSASSRLIATT